ncbi:MAG TPA: metalloregulator ArsR/SmtB family transcription factor [Gemmatimonadaceae bacterium]|nr:metalloregulator ArsR/SmtB family transcription factor [Gemmatimonadaceae bacterium]
MRAVLPLAPTPRALGERCCDPGTRSRISARDAGQVADDFEVLAHPVRLQLLDVLARNEGRVCVCDLEAAVPVKQPTVSHHLKLLRAAGLIEREKVGLWAYYRVNRPVLARLRERLSSTLAQFA